MAVFQDRVPTYPGRVKMTPVSGQANTYDLTRADNPVVEGTKLNKNFFKSIGAQVGDIQVTVRTNLGDSWLLCNGEPLDANTYPGLNALLPPGISKPNGKMTQQYNNGAAVAYGNGWWVALNCNGTSTSHLYWTRDFSPDVKTWNSWQVSGQNIYLQGLKFLNGRFVAYGRIYDSSGSGNDKPIIVYATDPSGTWSRVDSNIIQTYGVISDLWYAGGYYYLYMWKSSTNMWAYSTNLISWTKVASSTSSSNKPLSFAYGNGVWLRAYYENSKVYFYRSTDGINWSNVSLPRTYSNSNVEIIHNGERFVSVCFINGSTYYLLTSTDGLTWSEKVLAGLGSAVPVLKVGDVYILGNSVASSLDQTEFVGITYNGSSINPYSVLHGYDGTTFASGGKSLSSSTVVYYSDSKLLPAISHPDAYTYIKAKED